MARKWMGCKTLKEYKRNCRDVVRMSTNRRSVVFIAMKRYAEKNGSK